MKNRNKKAGVAIAAASVITAGAVTVAVAYQSGVNFQPKDSNRKLQNNQVVFSDNKDQVEHTEDDNGDNSELWEKNQNDQQDNNQENANQSDYLFQKDLQNGRATAVTVGVNSGDASGNNDQFTGTQNGTGSQNGGVYNLTDDTSNADIIINGNGTGQITDPNGNGASNGSGNSQNSTNGNGSSNNSGSDTNKTPSTDDKNNGNNNSDNNNGGSDNKRPSATAKDPEVKKEWNNRVDGVTDHPYPDDGISDVTEDEDGDYAGVVICQRWDADAVYMYKGQTIDQTLIYNSLDTFVYSNDRENRYVWGESALNQFIRIDAVSFDGGTTWKDQFPLTIPTTVTDDTMIIKVSYRLTKNKPWVERQVPYGLKANRIFVLSKEIQEENSVIDTDTILNYDQNPEVGSIVNLYRFQRDYLGTEPLTTLFPGWMEDGKLVSWLYTSTEGRHILEPAENVPLSSEYTVQLNVFWMTDDGKIDPSGNSLTYLQTLTGISNKAVKRMKDGTILDRMQYDELTVPEYIQAVSIDESTDLDVDYLKIPDTVIYLADSSKGLHVNRGYLVDEDNPVYQSTDEGVLLNKEATEILGIPYKLKKLTIPAAITNINLNADNQISEIHIEAETLDGVPSLSYENINHCKLVVPESYMEEFLEENNANIRYGTGNSVASADDPSVTYTMKSGVVISSKGEIRRIVSKNNTSVTLPNTAKQIEKDAFSKGTGIETLILPKNGTTLHLEDGCLNDSDVTAIWCYSKKQYDTVKEELADSGTDKDVSVELLQKSAEGYYYRISDAGIMLMSVPENLTSFDGTMTAEDGTSLEINAIAEQAFSDCQDLEWVTLPESIKKIGYKAFEDCIGLQGILINSTDTITIGNEAFCGCDSLRFVASNAMEGIMEDDYAPLISDSYSINTGLYYFYTPTDSTGYFDGHLSFTAASGVASYGLVDIGGDARMLYGLDSNGSPWIGLRSGGEVSDQVTLPESTTELFHYALADTKSPSGSYSVNWDDMLGLHWLDPGAFRNSDLGGSITLSGTFFYLDNDAFTSCNSITDFTVDASVYLGEGVFQDCKNMTNVSLGEFLDNSAVYFGLFTGCDSLRDIYFNSESAPKLMLYGTREYQFNYGWTEEEELEKLRIHVPESSKEMYIRDWRYAFAGYIDYPNKSAYDRMWEDIRWQHINWDTWEFPSDEEVDAYVAEALLKAENRARKALGMEEVSRLSEWYEYTVDSYGFVTLTGVPSYCTEATLDAETIGLASGGYLDNIGTGAFSKAKNLQKVVIPNGLSAIYSNAFAGVESDSVTLVFEGWAPNLFRSDDDILNGVPFSFGIDDSRIHIQVPEGWEDFYISMWEYIFAGYDTAEDMWAGVEADLAEQNGTEPTNKEILTEVNKRLVVSHNRIRAMMGLDPEQVEDNTSDGSGETTDTDPDGTTEGTTEENTNTDVSGNTVYENSNIWMVNTGIGNLDTAASENTDADRTDSDHEDADSAESEDTSADKDKKKSEDADVATKDTDAAIPEQEDTQE